MLPVAPSTSFASAGDAFTAFMSSAEDNGRPSKKANSDLLAIVGVGGAATSVGKLASERRPTGQDDGEGDDATEGDDRRELPGDPRDADSHPHGLAHAHNFALSQR